MNLNTAQLGQTPGISLGGYIPAANQRASLMEQALASFLGSTASTLAGRGIDAVLPSAEQQNAAAQLERQQKQDAFLREQEHRNFVASREDALNAYTDRNLDRDIRQQALSDQLATSKLSREDIMARLGEFTAGAPGRREREGLEASTMRQALEAGPLNTDLSRRIGEANIRESDAKTNLASLEGEGYRTNLEAEKRRQLMEQYGEYFNKVGIKDPAAQQQFIKDNPDIKEVLGGRVNLDGGIVPGPEGHDDTRSGFQRTLGMAGRMGDWGNQLFSAVVGTPLNYFSPTTFDEQLKHEQLNPITDMLPEGTLPNRAAPNRLSPEQALERQRLWRAALQTQGFAP